MLQTICLTLMISQPSRISASSATLIDNVFIPIPEETVSVIINYDISDNLPVYIKIKKAFTHSNPHYQSVFKSNRNTNASIADKLNKIFS